MGKNKRNKKKEQSNREKENRDRLKALRIEEEKRKWLKKISLILVIAVAGVVFAAAILWKLSGAGDAPAQKEVFKLGEEVVYLDEVNLCILQNIVNLGITNEMLNTTAQDGSNADDYYKNEILQLIMDYKVEAKLARKQGVVLSKEEEQSVRQDAVEYMGKIDGRVLKQLGITQDRVIEIYKERYLAHALEKTVTKDVEVEEQNYCTLYLLLFPKVETDADGDYVKEEDGETPVMLSEKEIAQKKADADTAYQELLAGSAIEEVADQYDVAAVSGEESNLTGSFGEPFSEYAKKLKQGEYSPVLDTASCYAIVKMVTENNETLAEQILEHYKSDLKKEAVEEKKAEWYEEVGISQEVDFLDNTWKSISLYDFVQYVEE